jgi:hypothetical protein
MNKMLLLYLMNIRVAIRTCFTCIVLDSVVIYSATIRSEALFKTTGACDTWDKLLTGQTTRAEVENTDKDSCTSGSGSFE